MERIINACRSETEAQAVVNQANRKRLSGRRIIEKAIAADTKLPSPIKDIINDKWFFKSYKAAA